ncbi:hypothetical protein CEXT_272901 [Caerostris extrusa]|uniref:Uncharacterized protein n=1 Tax=Caerostris extrusa TaxID=172846 RepID=A0AAV4VFE1_CAEEX|nr:hypothetical protein CEXT_272901 [Caerostris extrusa]
MKYGVLPPWVLLESEGRIKRRSSLQLLRPRWDEGPVALLPISAKPRNYNERRRDPSGKRGGKPRISFGQNQFPDLDELTTLPLDSGKRRGDIMFFYYHYSDAHVSR